MDAEIADRPRAAYPSWLPAEAKCHGEVEFTARRLCGCPAL
jgi:hypothetical protein